MIFCWVFYTIPSGAGFRWPIHSIIGIDCKPHCGYPNGLLEILHLPLRVDPSASRLSAAVACGN